MYPKTSREHAFDPTATALKTDLQFTGRSRKLVAEKSRFLEKFAKNVLHRDDLAPLYTHEIQVTEGGWPYWLMVQDKVFPQLERELKRGETFRAYFHFAGIAEGRQPVYLMVEFDSNAKSN